MLEELIAVTIILVLGFCSMLISVYAIYQILTNEFNGSKILWVLISLITVIGPMLWVIVGHKLVVKPPKSNADTSAQSQQ